MSRVSKQVAEAVALELTKSKKQELEIIQGQQAEFITEIYEASISDLIKQAFKKHKGFINSTTSIRLNGTGLSQGYKYYKLSKELPQCNSCGSFPVKDEDAAKIVKFENSYELKRKQYKELFESVELALVSLRTYNNIRKEFPEAAEYLPKNEQTTALVVNLKDIRCKLDKANC